jgi:formate transporter
MASPQELKDSVSDAIAFPQPPDLARETADALHAKAVLPAGSLIVLGLLAGVYISFGGLFALVALGGADDGLPHGVAQVLAGVVFVLGLMLVVVAGAELFTGNSLMAVNVAEGRLGVGALAKAWTIVYLANFAGSLAVVALAFWAGLHTEGEHAVGQAAVAVAAQKTAISPFAALCSGILANALVCLAVWMNYSARTTTDKFFAILLPIAAFVAAGLEHSIANMFLVPFGLAVATFAENPALATEGVDAVKLGTLSTGAFLLNLAIVTVGNVIGGALVGLAYWSVYLRGAAEDS